MSLKIIVKNSVNWSHGGIKSVFANHPKFSIACTGFVTFSLGDVIAQKLESGNKVLDLKRSMKVGVLGFVMNGMFLTRWFDYLDRVVGTCMHTKANVVIKVIADQLVYAPLAIMAYFSYATATLSKSPNGADSAFLSKMVDDFWPTFAADCTIWPVANVVNFRYVPLMYRASFTSFVALIWQTYLSVVAYAEGEQPEAVDGDGSDQK